MIVATFRLTIDEIDFVDSCLSTTLIISAKDEKSIWFHAESKAREFAFRFGKVREFTLIRID